MKQLLEKASVDFEIPALVHRGAGGLELAFDFQEEESVGTQRFIAAALEFVSAGVLGRLILADEFETAFHPLLVQQLMRILFESTRQSGPAQLLFTTHNPLLLDQTLLRRDQIWFTEKDQEGATRLYPLTDFKPRKDESLVKGYLAGRYGGIPFIPEGLKF